MNNAARELAKRGRQRRLPLSEARVTTLVVSPLPAESSRAVFLSYASQDAAVLRNGGTLNTQSRSAGLNTQVQNQTIEFRRAVT